MDEDTLFIQRFIKTVHEKMQSKYNLSEHDTDKLINESVFIDLIKEDAEFVVNYGVNYWVEDIISNLT